MQTSRAAMAIASTMMAAPVLPSMGSSLPRQGSFQIHAFLVPLH